MNLILHRPGEITEDFKACFEVSDVDENVKNTGMSAVRSVLGTFTYDQVRYFLILQIFKGSNVFNRLLLIGTSSINNLIS